MPPKPTPTRYSNRLDFTPLKQRRRAALMSQAELARLVGVHPITITRVERNQREPSLKLVLSIAQVFGTPITQLFQLHPDSPSDARK